MEKNDFKIIIPPLTFIKIFLRGIGDFSFIREIKKNISKMETGERKGITTQKGVAVYFEKVSQYEAVVVTAYNIGKEKEDISKRAEALFGILLQKI